MIRLVKFTAMNDFSKLCFTLVLILAFPLGWIQSFGQALPVKPAQDYFDSPQGQSYHRQKVISTMKKEVNSYSERVHDLQSRFYEIFYGRDYDNSFDAPFQNTLNPEPPVRSEEKKLGHYVSPKEIVVEDSPSRQLAFEVDVLKDGQPDDPSSNGKRFLGGGNGYWILRPGMTFPHAERKGSYGGPVKFRKYKPGFSLDLAGGYTFDNLMLGVGGIFRRNEFDDESWEGVPGNRMNAGSSSMTLAGYVDLGISHNLSPRFDLLARLGLGYGVSIIEDFSTSLSTQDRTRYDPTFFGSVGLGARWRFSEKIVLDFGYRYLLEDETPAHCMEAGLAGNF